MVLSQMDCEGRVRATIRDQMLIGNGVRKRGAAGRTAHTDGTGGKAGVSQGSGRSLGLQVQMVTNRGSHRRDSGRPGLPTKATETGRDGRSARQGEAKGFQRGGRRGGGEARSGLRRRRAAAGCARGSPTGDEG